MPAKRPDTTTKYDAFSTGSALRKQNQDVRVGYIDPERGYIDGLTVYRPISMLRQILELSSSTKIEIE